MIQSPIRPESAVVTAEAAIDLAVDGSLLGGATSPVTYASMPCHTEAHSNLNVASIADVEA